MYLFSSFLYFFKVGALCLVYVLSPSEVLCWFFFFNLRKNAMQQYIHGNAYIPDRLLLCSVFRTLDFFYPPFYFSSNTLILSPHSFFSFYSTSSNFRPLPLLFLSPSPSFLPSFPSSSSSPHPLPLPNSQDGRQGESLEPCVGDGEIRVLRHILLRFLLPWFLPCVWVRVCLHGRKGGVCACTCVCIWVCIRTKVNGLWNGKDVFFYFDIFR